MAELPVDPFREDASPGRPASPPASTSRRVKGPRPFYRKKRYIIPALLLAAGLLAPADEDGVDTISEKTPGVAATSPSPTPSPTEDQAAAGKAAEEKAKADKAAADKLAAEKAAAEAAAQAEAKRVAAAAEAARVEAARVAAAEAARVEAARVAAEQAAAAAAAAEAARLADAPAAVYYANCDAVRQAGAAPIRRGEPGYASKLDRDGDGIACDT